MDIENSEYCSFVIDSNENESDMLGPGVEDDIQAHNNGNEVNNVHCGKHTITDNNDAQSNDD